MSVNLQPEGVNLQQQPEQKNLYSFTNIAKFVGFSLFGVLLFFTPITINKVNTIPLDHLITFINKLVPLLGPIFTLCIIFIGGVLPWVQKTYKKDALSFAVSVFRTLGIPVGIIGFLSFLNIAKIGPEWIHKPDMMPFLFDKVIMAVAMIVPIGSAFLTFIICFGFLEFIGVLVNPFMRPVYKVPGKAAIDAVASFVGSFSVAIFLTNRLYNEGKYTNKEAVIIMSGFSTVSATFMIIIARTAKLMDMWNFYFWSTFIICFAVTAVTVRLWPITRVDDSYIDGVGKPEPEIKGNLLACAFKEGLMAAAQSKSLAKVLWENLVAGIKMIFVLTPSAASLGLLAFILVKTTSVFDIFGLLFAPFTLLLSLFGFPEPMMVAKACAIVLGEMFVPNILVAGLPMAAKYVVAVTSVCAIIFFAGSIPCMLAVEIKFKPWEMLVVWFERTALSILFAGIVALIVF